MDLLLGKRVNPRVVKCRGDVSGHLNKDSLVKGSIPVWEKTCGDVRGHPHRTSILAGPREHPPPNSHRVKSGAGARASYSNSERTLTPLLVSTIGIGRSTPGGWFFRVWSM